MDLGVETDAGVQTDVPQTDAQGLKKKQCSLGALPNVRENCFSHVSVQLYVKRVHHSEWFACV